MLGHGWEWQDQSQYFDEERVVEFDEDMEGVDDGTD